MWWVLCWCEDGEPTSPGDNRLSCRSRGCPVRVTSGATLCTRSVRRGRRRTDPVHKVADRADGWQPDGFVHQMRTPRPWPYGSRAQSGRSSRWVAAGRPGRSAGMVSRTAGYPSACGFSLGVRGENPGGLGGYPLKWCHLPRYARGEGIVRGDNPRPGGLPPWNLSGQPTISAANPSACPFSPRIRIGERHLPPEVGWRVWVARGESVGRGSDGGRVVGRIERRRRMGACMCVRRSSRVVGG